MRRYIRVLDRGKSTIAQISSPVISPERLHTPVSISLSSPSSDNQTVEIQKYIVTDPQRLYRKREDMPSLPFAFRTLHPMVQSNVLTFHPRTSSLLSRTQPTTDPTG